MPRWPAPHATRTTTTQLCRPTATAATRPTSPEPTIRRTWPPASRPLAHVPHHDELDRATFNHNTTSFPLTGAHTTVACAQCHTNNNYTDAAHGLLRLPPGGLHRNHEPGARGGRLPDRLHAVPLDNELDVVHLQSLVGVPADRVPRHAGLRAVPHQQQLHNRADHLLRLPPGRLHRHQ